MLVYFYSDRNYVLNGFSATYAVYACPYNCSNHGVCVDHTCTCPIGYKGVGCEVEMCPGNMCGDHGSCRLDLETCECNDGYIGGACTLPQNSTGTGATWHLLAPSSTNLDVSIFTPRAGHAGSYLTELESLYVFGGTSLNHLLDDLLKYDIVLNRWDAITKGSPWPTARKEHAMVSVSDAFYMFGGELEGGIHSNELWYFDGFTNVWTLKAGGSTVVPQGVSGHTLTLVDDEWLYLFAGRNKNGTFLSDMYRYSDTAGTDQWERVVSRYGSLATRRLVGHSTVYHPESR